MAAYAPTYPSRDQEAQLDLNSWSEAATTVVPQLPQPPAVPPAVPPASPAIPGAQVAATDFTVVAIGTLTTIVIVGGLYFATREPTVRARRR